MCKKAQLGKSDKLWPNMDSGFHYHARIYIPKHNVLWIRLHSDQTIQNAPIISILFLLHPTRLEHRYTVYAVVGENPKKKGSLVLKCENMVEMPPLKLVTAPCLDLPTTLTYSQFYLDHQGQQLSDTQ